MPLEIAYSPVLVMASLGVAIMAAFTSLRLTSNLRDFPAQRRKARVVQAAFALGSGIWSMRAVRSPTSRWSSASTSRWRSIRVAWES